MRESYRAVDSHAAARAGAPHGAREIAESVGGKQRGTFERRNEKAARKMRPVVLDAVKLCPEFFGIGIKGRRQRLGNASELRENLEAFPCERRHAQRVKKLCAQPRVRVSRPGNVIDVLKGERRFL